MSDDLVYTEPKETPIATRDGAADQDAAWNAWLRGHLDIEREYIFDNIIEWGAEAEVKRDRQIRQLELKIAELTGALNVLRTGKTMRVRGTYDEGAKYERFDVVALDGSSFVAREDNPGKCPGEHWQLMASAGRRGARGLPGPKGERGERGESAPAEAGFMALHLDRKDYSLLLSTTDGKIHTLNLRPLFEQFVADMQGKR